MLDTSTTAQPEARSGGSQPESQPGDPQRFFSLRLKLWLIIAATVLSLVALLYLPLRNTVLSRFVDLEHQDMETNLNRTSEALRAQLDVISKSARDYGAWDDSYAYMVEPDPAYVTSNLDDAIFQNNRMNLVMILDASGTIVFSKTYDFDNSVALPFPQELSGLSASDFVKFSGDVPRKSGVVLLPDKAIMLGSSPILPTSGQGESRGAFIFGRFLSPDVVTDLANTTKLTLTVHLLNQPTNLPPETAARLQGGERAIVAPLDSQRIQGFTFEPDIYGKPALGIQIDDDRSIYTQGLRGVNYFMLILSGGAVVFALIVVGLLNWLILGRVSVLSKQVESIGVGRDTSVRVPVSGNDELTRLSLSINHMLEALQEAEHEHMISDEERARLQENLIQVQQATLDRLSTPIIPISDSVIVMPLIGDIDDLRATKILESLLQGISQMRSRTAIIDITGIFGVTPATISLLTRMIGAVHLLGTRLVLTGISAEVAQTLAKNPDMVAGISTYSNLQQAIVSALRS